MQPLSDVDEDVIPHVDSEYRVVLVKLSVKIARRPCIPPHDSLPLPSNADACEQIISFKWRWKLILFKFRYIQVQL